MIYFVAYLAFLFVVYLSIYFQLRQTKSVEE